MRSFLSIGRFRTSLAGAVVVLVVSVAFFMMFDLSVALGSSSGLPIVHICQGSPADPDSEVAEEGQASAASTTLTTVAQARQDSSPRNAVSSSPQEGATNQVESQTDTTAREYVEEEVQVRGRRPDPKTEHPGQGIGLLKNPKKQ